MKSEEIDLEKFHAAGVDTVFLREGVDTSMPTGELFRNIMASLAEFEGRVIYERLSKGKRRKATEGGYTGSWLPTSAKMLHWKDR
jgi:DNA invertase Pin-like site-specific DNA recombinase